MKRIFLPDELKSSDPLAFLCRADEQGLLIAPEESFEAFSARMERLQKELPANLPSGLPEVSDSVREAASKITENSTASGWIGSPPVTLRTKPDIFPPEFP